ncbi:hypothetical protein SOPP22_15680 [Shewanella sp. OPT22]|nr:hypothetical protein SOPP22_15680 [Shewanella sp. OPT22]
MTMFGNVELQIWYMVVFLLILHAIFAIKPAISDAPIPPSKKLKWSVMGILFGPIGYYVYQASLPFENIENPADFFKIEDKKDH